MVLNDWSREMRVSSSSCQGGSSSRLMHVCIGSEDCVFVADGDDGADEEDVPTVDYLLAPGGVRVLPELLQLLRKVGVIQLWASEQGLQARSPLGQHILWREEGVFEADFCAQISEHLGLIFGSGRSSSNVRWRQRAWRPTPCPRGRGPTGRSQGILQSNLSSPRPALRRRGLRRRSAWTNESSALARSNFALSTSDSALTMSSARSGRVKRSSNASSASRRATLALYDFLLRQHHVQACVGV